ncbi:MAG: sugar phosphate isomerase/epimerase [Bacteroidota bacterium]
MKTIKGPAIFLAQFADDTAPYNSLPGLCKWAAEKGYKAIQIPSWDNRCIDLELAYESDQYVSEVLDIVKSHGLEISELSTHLQGQLVAVHPAYDTMFDAFAPQEKKQNPAARTDWAIDQVKKAAAVSRKLGIDRMATFSGALLWQTMYPWPQRPPGLVETGFKELAKRWQPILDFANDQDVDVCYEIHPGEDLHDGITFEKFLEATGNHNKVKILYDPSHLLLQQMDYLAYIDIYRDYIKMFHVKDAEYHPDGRSGVYGGYQSWIDRPGRFRSLGDGQVDFKQIFSKLSQYDYDGWAVLEWECCIKSPEQGASEGAPFISDCIIEVTEKAFDDFAGAASDEERNKQILGIKN